MSFNRLYIWWKDSKQKLFQKYQFIQKLVTVQWKLVIFSDLTCKIIFNWQIFI